MRWVVALLLVTVALAGCTYDEDPDRTFTPTCPNWVPSPSVPQWKVDPLAMQHNADGGTEEARNPNDWSKWIPTPGDVHDDSPRDANGTPIPDSNVKIYGSGTLAFVELTFTNVSLLDSLLVFEAYRAADSERAITPSGETPIPPTGSRLQFKSALSGGVVSSEVRFGPHLGNDDVMWNQSAHVYLDLQPAPDKVDPSRVRIDARYYGNQDGDPTTDGTAWFQSVRAKFWYLHNDCIS